MTPTLTTPRPRTPRPARRLAVAAGALALTAALGLGGLALLGRGPASGGTLEATGVGEARFNFRVTLIPVPGRVEGVSARVRFDPRRLEATTGTVTVDLRQLETGIELRDEHARNYLGVEAHPKAVFTLEKLSGADRLEPSKDMTATANGRLELNGVSTPLAAPVTLRLEPDKARVLVRTKLDVVFKDHRIAIPGADPRTDVTVSFAVPTSSRP